VPVTGTGGATYIYYINMRVEGEKMIQDEG
jgi:hypothetical protein